MLKVGLHADGETRPHCGATGQESEFSNPAKAQDHDVVVRKTEMTSLLFPYRSVTLTKLAILPSPKVLHCISVHRRRKWICTEAQTPSQLLFLFLAEVAGLHNQVSSEWEDDRRYLCADLRAN